MEFLKSFPRVGLHVAAIALTAICTYVVLRLFFKEKLVDKLVKDQVFKEEYDRLEYILAIAATFFATSCQSYNVFLWEDPAKSSIWANSALSVLLTMIVFGKRMKTHIAKGETKMIKALEDDNAKIAQSRNWLVETAETIDVILAHKLKRISPLVKKTSVKPTEIVSIDCVKSQVVIIVQQIYELFSAHLKAGQKLRIGIYFRSETSKDSLELGYSWNGQTEDCFSKKSSDFHKIVRVESVMSELAKCYNSQDGMILISSCPQAVRESSFTYLHPAQSGHIKSMLLYRGDFKEGNGEPWIICLDSDQEGYFESAKMADYKFSLERVSKRISFELVTLSIATKFTHT